MPTISIADPLQINAIVWIHSLVEAEMGPTRRILDDLVDLGQSGGLPVLEFAVANRQELFDLLGTLALRVEQGLRPILHFDTHGNPDAGLYLAPDKEWATWQELIDALRTINVATGNNLVVVFALCYGLHLYKLVELKKPTPAYLFAGVEAAVSVGFLETQTLAFYRQVLQNGAFLEPFEATFGKQMSLMNCQGLFLRSLAHYVKTHCRGKVLDQRVERTVVQMLARDGITHPTAEDIDGRRRRARALLEPSQSIIDHFAPLFLIGRPPGFGYEDVEKLSLAGSHSS